MAHAAIEERRRLVLSTQRLLLTLCKYQCENQMIKLDHLQKIHINDTGYVDNEKKVEYSWYAPNTICRKVGT